MNLKFLKSFSKIKNRISLNEYRLGSSPKRDWKILLVSFFVLMLLSAGFGVYAYFQVENGSFFTSDLGTTVSDVKTINKNKLEAVVDFYKNKEADFNKIQKEVVNYVDPSV